MLSGGSFYREWVAILPYVVKIGKSFYIYFLHKVSNSFEFLCISIVNLFLKINQSWIFVYLFHFTKLMIIRDLGGQAAQCKHTVTPQWLVTKHLLSYVNDPSLYKHTQGWNVETRDSLPEILNQLVL